MKKHIIYLLIFIVLTGILVYLCFPQLYIKMVSEKVEKLERAIVIVKDWTNGQNSYVIEITEKDQLNKLYSIIKNTIKIEINRYPEGESIVTCADSLYEVQLFYSNGKIDRFGTIENSQFVFRILENNYNGYIVGQNSDLLAYVLTSFK